MKKSILLIISCFILTLKLSAQTLNFHEDFELPSLADSVTSHGDQPWGISKKFHHNGLRCDTSKIVAVNDTIILETNTISTLGDYVITLDFWHICKIEISDYAVIEYSINNGQTWTRVTRSQYTGSGIFNGNKFSSGSYPATWLPTQNNTPPQNTWWKHERFNLNTALANQAQVKLRFMAFDNPTTPNGGMQNYGWLIDDIKLICSICEIDPPTIALNTPIVQDTVYNTGNVTISANITDISNIDTAMVVFKRNNGIADTIGMTPYANNIFKGDIPCLVFDESISYKVIAKDNSLLHNLGVYPDSNWLSFYIKQGQGIITIGNDVTYQSNIPVNGNNNYGWSAMLYLKDEMKSGGRIDTISFYVDNVSSSYVMANQKVYLSNTGLSVFADGSKPDPNQMTLVYDGSVNWTGPGWVKIPLSNPFVYDGYNNLMIYWENRNGTLAAGFPNFRYTTTTPNKRAKYKCQNSSFPTTSGTTSLTRPNIKIDYNIVREYDAGVNSINTPSGITYSDTALTVNIKIKNFGTAPLSYATIGWSVDGIIKSNFYWTSSLNNGLLYRDQISLPFNIGTHLFTSGYHEIKVWIKNPNGFPDENINNDTIISTFLNCNTPFNGTYLVGTGNTRFKNLTQVVTALSSCGIDGAVVFEFKPGTYYEQVIIPQINGSSSQNTITFKSLNNDSTSVNIVYTPSTANSNYTIKLDGADNLIFKNITVSTIPPTTGNLTYSRVIDLSNNATNNKFIGNKFVSPATASGTQDKAIIFSNTGNNSLDSNNIFTNNLFSGGCFGLYLNGNSNTVLENRNEIRYNTFVNQANGAIYLAFQKNCIIEGNYVTTNTASTSFSAVSVNESRNFSLFYNKLNVPNSGNGIYLNKCEGINSNYSLVSNNFIYVGGTNASIGANFNLCKFINFYYNSINVTSTNTTSGKALAISGTSTDSLKINIKNNIIANLGGGYAIHTNVTKAKAGIINYNDLYTTGTVLGFWGANKNTITVWRTASKMDSMSVSVNPLFFSNTNLHTLSFTLSGKAIPLTEVSDDIDKEPRSTSTPDIGADEYAPLAKDLGLISMISPNSDCGLTNSNTVKVKIVNWGTDTVFSIPIRYNISGPINSTINETFNYTLHPSDTVEYTFTNVANLSVPGVYQFKAWVNLNADLNYYNDTIYKTVNSLPIINNYPYTENFEGSFSGWLSGAVSGNDFWEFGTPSHATINSAHSGNNAWTTGLTSSYPPSANAYLLSPCLDFTNLSAPQMWVWLNVKTEPTSDAMTLEYSVNNGNWVVISDPTFYIAGGKWSGNTNGWKKFRTALPAALKNKSNVRLRFVFKSNTTNEDEGIAIDDISIFNRPYHDAGIVEILSPTNVTVESLNQKVIVKFKNFGLDTIKVMDLKYKIDNGTIVSKTWNGRLAPNSTNTDTIPAYTVPAGLYNLACFTSLLNDSISENDTISKSYRSTHVEFLSYRDDFEAAQTLWGDSTIDTATTRWQLGMPNWGVTNTTHSGTKAWDINLDTCYDINASAMLYSPFYSFYDVKGAKMVFWYNYKTQKSNDGVRIEYLSTETGNATWKVLGALNDTINGKNWYNSTISSAANKPGWSGESNGWKKAEFKLDFLNYRLYTRFRFIFTSDDATQLDGFSIDDFGLFRPEPHELQAVEIASPNSGCNLGNENVSVIFRNVGVETVNGGLTASYQINPDDTLNPGPIITENVDSIIQPNQICEFRFANKPDLSVIDRDSIFKFKVWCTLTGDTIHGNDTIKNYAIKSFKNPTEDPIIPTVINYAKSITLHINSLDSIKWYKDSLGIKVKIGRGQNLITPILYDTIVYYVQIKRPDSVGVGNTIIGNPASITTNSTTNGATPYGYTGGKNLRSQFLIRASELKAAGLSAGNINSIEFKLKTLGYNNENFTIKIDTTSVNTLNSWVTDTLIKVYENISLSTYIGWNKHRFNQQFNWDGEKNLIIETCFYNTSFDSPNNALVYTSPTSYYSSLCYSAAPSVTDICDNNGYNPAKYLYRPNIRINGKVIKVDGCLGNMRPDTVYVINIPKFDAGVLSVLSPNSSNWMSDTSKISVILRNYSDTIMTNIPLNYIIDTLPPVTEFYTKLLKPKTIDTFKFVTPADLSFFKAYNIKAYSSDSLDQTFINDTAKKVVICSMPDYCESKATSPSGSDIGNIKISNLDNGIASPTTLNGYATGTYTDYTDSMLVNFNPGFTYPISISQITSANTVTPAYVKAYIDFNKNGTFEESSEKIFGNFTTSANTTLTGNVVIPITAKKGYTKMRVVLKENSTATGVTPCSVYPNGETEDYLVRIYPVIHKDAGITKIKSPKNPENEGDNLKVIVTLTNFGLDTLKSVLITYKLNNNNPVEYNWTGVLNPFTSVDDTLQSFVCPRLDNTITIFTTLSGDVNTFNDKSVVKFYGIPKYDAKILKFTQPTSPLPADTIGNVEIFVKNIGCDTLRDIPVNYTINDTGLVSLIRPGILLPGDSFNIVMPSFIVPEATYKFTAFTSVPNEGNPKNDTIISYLYGVFQSQIPYYDNFDVKKNWFTNSVGNTKWQLGRPNYGSTNSSNSNPNSWDINLKTAYGSNANSMLYSQYFDFSGLDSVRLSFWVNYNTEENQDGVYIEYSNNGSLTWQTLGTLNDTINATNWYNGNVTGNKIGWTGNSKGWKRCEYKLDLLSNVDSVRFRFVFKSNNSTQLDGFSIDNFSLKIFCRNDAGVDAIISPIYQTNADVNAKVKAIVKNYGFDVIRSLTLKYQINNDPPVETLRADSILPDSTKTYEFNTPFISPTGVYSVKVFTELNYDCDLTNDTAFTTIVGKPIMDLPYFDDFESTNYWYTADTSEWERGTPTSSVIYLGHNSVQAWKTNLDGNYENNIRDTLYSPKFNFTYAVNPKVSFWQWMDAEVGKDYGYMQISTDGGRLWTSLGYYYPANPDTSGTYWYNFYINGRDCWSSKNNYWLQSKYKLKYNFWKDPVQFRFIFKSNASTVANGWAIDDFAITFDRLKNDVGVKKILTPSFTCNFGDTIYPKVILRNFGTNVLKKCTLYVEIDNHLKIEEIWEGEIKPAENGDYIFKKFFLAPSTPFKMKVYPKLTGDTYVFNDTATTSVSVIPPPYDAQISSIESPKNFTILNKEVVVVVEIKNVGLKILDSLSVGYFIKDSVPVVEKWRGRLIQNKTAYFTFKKKFISPSQPYKFCAYTIYSLDNNINNDTNWVTINISDDIRENYNTEKLEVGQNIPNPAKELTTINYSIPHTGKVEFKLYNLTGFVVFEKNIFKEQGRHFIEINTANLPPSVYFYAVRFENQLVTKKMVILK